MHSRMSRLSAEQEIEELRRLAGVALSSRKYREAETFNYKLIALLDDEDTTNLEKYHLWRLEAHTTLLLCLALRDCQPLVNEELKHVFELVNSTSPMLYRPVSVFLNQATESLYQVGQSQLALSICLYALSITQRKPQELLDELSRTRNNHAAILITLGRFSEAEEILKTHLAILKKHRGPLHLSIATILNNLGELYRQRGQHHEAYPLIQESLIIRLQLLPESHSLVAQSRHNLGSLEFSLGQLKAADEMLSAALAVRREFSTEAGRAQALIPTLVTLSDIRLQQRFPHLALGLAEEAVELAQGLYGPTSPKLIPMSLLLSEIKRQLKRYDDAEKDYLHAEELAKKNNINDPMQQATLLVGKSGILFDQKKFNQSEYALDDAMKIVRKAHSQHHPEVSRLLILLAKVYDKGHRDNRTKTCIKGAVDLIKQAYGLYHYRLLDCLWILATFSEDRGQYEQAEDYARQILSILNLNETTCHGLMPQTLALLGRICFATKRPHDARQHYRDAVEKHIEFYGDKDEGLLEIYGELAAVEEYLQDYQQALRFAQDGLKVAGRYFPENDIVIGFINHRMMNLHRKLKQIDKSISCGNKALVTYTEKLGPDHEDTLKLSRDLDALINPHLHAEGA